MINEEGWRKLTTTMSIINIALNRTPSSPLFSLSPFFVTSAVTSGMNEFSAKCPTEMNSPGTTVKAQISDRSEWHQILVNCDLIHLYGCTADDY